MIDRGLVLAKIYEIFNAQSITRLRIRYRNQFFPSDLYYIVRFTTEDVVDEFVGKMDR